MHSLILLYKHGEEPFHIGSVGRKTRIRRHDLRNMDRAWEFPLQNGL